MTIPLPYPSRIFSSIFFFGLLAFPLSANGRIEFLGLSSSPISVIPDSNSGLNEIFVIIPTDNWQIVYTPQAADNITFHTFHKEGTVYATDLKDISFIDGKYYINNCSTDCGYIINEGSRQMFFWLVDYSKVIFEPLNLRNNSNNYCDYTLFNFSGKADPIYYFGITGRRFTIDREIELSYSTFQWNETDNSFNKISKTDYFSYLNNDIIITPPITAETTVILTGDKFLKEWNKPVFIECNFNSPEAIDINASVIKDENNDENSNEITSNTTTFGGNAPCHFQFIADVTPNTIHNEWQIASDDNFNNILYHFYNNSFEYTFNEHGSYYVRFIGSNYNGSCEKISETFNIEIGDSQLLIPNVFSPNNDGINDMWKVSYKSLIKYECWIFNRNGKLLYKSTDPSEGWDGKVNGQTIKSGVFYYIIKAEGSDHKVYNLSGDINVISSLNNSNKE